MAPFSFFYQVNYVGMLFIDHRSIDISRHEYYTVLAIRLLGPYGDDALR